MRYAKITLMFVLSFMSMLFVFVGFVGPHTVEIPSNICIKPDSGYNYRTCEQLNFKVGGQMIIVPKGYSTNLASVPKALWSIISPAKSEIMAGSILHDFLYEKDCRYTRKMADDIFYRALRMSGVSFYDSAKFYAGVRVFGARHFKQCSS